MIKLLDREFSENDAFYIELEQWYKERPAVIQSFIKQYPPYCFFIYTTTDQLVSAFSYNENGNITVLVQPEHNLHKRFHPQFPFTVFGVDPSDLAFYCWFDDDKKLSNWKGCKFSQK